MNPIDVINNIRQTEYHLSEDGKPRADSINLLNKLHKMGKRLSEGLYERSDHFIFELIQNAEDNDYAKNVVPTLRFELLESDPTESEDAKGCLCIYNNELGFSEANVRAICNFDDSTKKGNKSQDLIGEKGLGFKSVFMVSNSPHIISNGYQFKFFRNDPVATVGYVIPYWLDKIPGIIANQAKLATVILLPLRDDNYEFIKKQLEDFDSEIILFLKKLKVLEIVTPSAESLIRCEVQEKVKTLSSINQIRESVTKFWMESVLFKVPDDLHEEERVGIKSSEVTVAFPLDGLTGDERLFAYLPTEERPGFPFHINADFLLPSSRESIHKNKNWNNWLLRNVSVVVVNGISAMLQSDDYKYRCYSFIPLPLSIREKDTYHPICAAIRDALRSMNCVITERLGLLEPDRCYRAANELRELLSEAKPSCFNDIDLIHYKTTDYATQLEYIGVGALKAEQVREIFNDDKWIAGHDDEWLIKAYRYLTALFKKSNVHLDFKIIRTDENQFVTPKEVFLPVQEQTERELKKIPIKYRERINFVSGELYKKLVNDSEADFIKKLSLGNFSIQRFLEEIFIPSIQEDLHNISEKDFQYLFLLFIGLAENISEGEFESLCSQLPILQDGGQLYRDIDIITLEIVVPKKWNKKDGWQRLFVTDLERSNLFILHDFYASLDFNEAQRYFDAIDATSIPDAVSIELNAYDTYRPHSIVGESYIKYISEEFLRNNAISSTRQKIVESWLTPSILRDDRLSKACRLALVKWLNEIIDSQFYLIRYAKAHSFYRTANIGRLDSELFKTLTTTAWVDTTKGLMRPGQVFVKDDTIHRIFGDRLPYLRDRLSARVIDTFGVHKGATEETMIGFLKDLSASITPERMQLIAIYKYLNDHCDGYEKSFRQDSLIFVPNRGGRWVSSCEVIWDDASAVSGDSFGWLEEYYPDTLKDFFVKKLDVKQSIDDKVLLEAWIRIQDDDNDVSAIESVMSLAIPAVLRLIGSAIESIFGSLWLSPFFSDALVWTQDKTWEAPADVFIPDDNRLKSLFSDDLHYVWIPEGFIFSRLDPLGERLSIRRLSQAVELSILEADAGIVQSEKQYLTVLTIKLIAHALVNLDKQNRGDFLRLLEDGSLRKLAFCKEVIVDDISISCEIDYCSKIVDGYSAYWDADNERLYVKVEAEKEDVFDDIAEQLSKFLWSGISRDHSDTLQKLIGVTSDNRYKKLRDNKNWHLPHEVNQQLNKIFEEADEQVETKTVPAYVPVSYVVESKDTEEIATLLESNPAARKSTDEKPIHNQGLVQTGSPIQRHNRIPRLVIEGSGTEPALSQDVGDQSYRNAVGDGETPPLNTKERRSRSRGIASSINNARRNRMLSYVIPRLLETDELKSGADAQAFRKELGRLAELEVLNDLTAKGWEARSMPENNPGYDIEAVNPGTGEFFFIEVKGESFFWSEKGVGISRTQYDLASKAQGNFVLAVVENLRAGARKISYLRDPVAHIVEFRFDHGWRALATELSIEAAGLQQLDSWEKLLELTDSDVCRQLIEYCQVQEFPFPEVGFEFVDEVGAVLEEIELAWDQERIGVVLSCAQLEKVQGLSKGWDLYQVSEIELIKKSLNAVFLVVAREEYFN